MTAQSNKRIRIATITGVHGVRGAVRVRSFTEDQRSIASFSSVTDVTGARTFKLAIQGESKDQLLVMVEGITTRTQAEQLKGTDLFITRDQLPALKGKRLYYHADLIGLRAETLDGEVIGTISALHDFGAGSILQVARRAGGDVMLPFSKTVVPQVDLAGGRIVINPPVGWMENEARP